ncbi:MAG: quinohemoprotein amine dehydrogenase subunit alpha [Acidobacteriia bacterium]|nr:quinohemoprotein amine dehydrogenase subunit alpha [Terriglobia bacterium]
MAMLLPPRRAVCFMVAGLTLGATRFGVAQTEAGIPVTDPLVIAKCGTCHPRDSQGYMQYISWERTTPEGWQDALKRMILAQNLTITPAEARSIVKYLSAAHGLAPQEAKAVMYEAERRMHEETDMGNPNLQDACGKCHSLARSLAWRRSADDWNWLAAQHETRFKVKRNAEAIAYLSKAAPLHTAEWDSWSKQTHAPNLEGRWLVTANLKARGQYYGEMQITPAGSRDEFNTRVTLKSIKDGSTIERTGATIVFAGHAWRGRSKGSQPVGAAPDDVESEMRETLWIAPDQNTAEGRWFWGQYQEFGFDVTLRRPAAEATLLAVDVPSLKTNSQNNRIRVIGDKIPGKIGATDLGFGPGVTVKRIVSQGTAEIVAEVDVAANAAPGWRDVALRRSVLPKGIAVYDHIDYLKVTPESALAAFGDQKRSRGYQQFEVTAYHGGPDGKLHTADDVPLGPVDAAWSLQIFYAPEGSNTDHVGTISSSGFFKPAAVSPESNFDVWVIATATSEKDKAGKPLVGKAYLVVTVPSYTFNGRRYVRDLGRWVDDGPASN